MPDPTSPVQARNPAREIAVPPAARALSTPSRIDYENAVLVAIDAVDDSARDRTAEQWARAVHEDAPADTRRALTQGWTRFGLRLGPAHSDRHVLGWPIRRSTPDHVLLGTGSENGLQVELLIQHSPHTLLFASFVQRDTDAARTLWAEVEHMHTPVMCRLLDEAVVRVASCPRPTTGEGDPHANSPP